MIIPKCDMCNGTAFDVVSTDPEPPTTYALASEYYRRLGQPQSSDLLLRYHHYKATCKKCKAVYEYIAPF